MIGHMPLSAALNTILVFSTSKTDLNVLFLYLKKHSSSEYFFLYTTPGYIVVMQLTVERIIYTVYEFQKSVLRQFSHFIQKSVVVQQLKVFKYEVCVDGSLSRFASTLIPRGSLLHCALLVGASLTHIFYVVSSKLTSVNESQQDPIFVWLNIKLIQIKFIFSGVNVSILSYFLLE